MLSSKYFPDGNIFKPKRVKRTSYTWSSIAAATVILKYGFGWQVGDGKSINIRDDKLGIEGLNGSSLDSNMITPSVNRVSDL